MSSTKFTPRRKIGPTPKVCHKSPPPPTNPQACNAGITTPLYLTAKLDQKSTPDPNYPFGNPLYIQLTQIAPLTWDASAPPTTAPYIRAELRFTCDPLKYFLRIYGADLLGHPFETHIPTPLEYNGPTLIHIDPQPLSTLAPASAPLWTMEIQI